MAVSPPGDAPEDAIGWIRERKEGDKIEVVTLTGQATITMFEGDGPGRVTAVECSDGREYVYPTESIEADDTSGRP